LVYKTEALDEVCTMKSMKLIMEVGLCVRGLNETLSRMTEELYSAVAQTQ